MPPCTADSAQLSFFDGHPIQLTISYFCADYQGFLGACSNWILGIGENTKMHKLALAKGSSDKSDVVNGRVVRN